MNVTNERNKGNWLRVIKSRYFYQFVLTSVAPLLGNFWGKMKKRKKKKKKKKKKKEKKKEENQLFSTLQYRVPTKLTLKGTLWAIGDIDLSVYSMSCLHWKSLSECGEYTYKYGSRPYWPTMNPLIMNIYYEIFVGFTITYNCIIIVWIHKDLNSVASNSWRIFLLSWILIGTARIASRLCL